MALLEVKNLIKSYGDRTVLDGVSFALDEGEANVIMAARTGAGSVRASTTSSTESTISA